MGILTGAYLLHPQSNLQNGWRPFVPLNVNDPVTLLTKWKLSEALSSPETCLAALGTSAQPISIGALANDNPACGIESSVLLTAVGQARLSVQTACSTALRTAMWGRHGLQPLAQEFFGTQLTQIDNIGSFSCREMRTSNGSTGRMSTHATAEAIDIAGFRFADGTRLRLIADWDDPGPKGAFLHAARDSACDWFRVTLSPDYNQLHADHFHLQSTGWGLCR